MAQKFLFLVRSQPFDGREAEFTQYYDEQHVPDLLNVPGIISARRFKVIGGTPGWPDSFVGLYEIEAEDPSVVSAEMAKRYGTDAMPRSPSVDSSKTVHVTAVEVMPLRRASGKT